MSLIMANKKFKDNNTLDSSQVYNTYKDDTLDNIIENIPTTTSQLANDSGFVTKNTLYNTFNTSSTNGVELFKSYVISNAVPLGITIWYLGLNGAVSAAIVQKASNNYASFIQFDYARPAIQYRYIDGTWYVNNLG